MLKLSPGCGGEPTHECLNAEWSLLMNVETEPGMWRGAHSWMSKCRKVTTLECWNWVRDVEGAHSWMSKCRKVTALECWNWAWDVKGAERLFTLEYWNWTKVLSSLTLPDIWTNSWSQYEVTFCYILCDLCLVVADAYVVWCGTLSKTTHPWGPFTHAIYWVWTIVWISR